MTVIGTRVGAIRSSKEDELYFYGYGVYIGDKIHPELGFPNPCIKLDTGKIVWGCECWWGPEDRIADRITRFNPEQITMVEGTDE